MAVSSPPEPQRFAIEADPVRAGLAIARTAQRVGELAVTETTLAEPRVGDRPSGPRR